MTDLQLDDLDLSSAIEMSSSSNPPAVVAGDVSYDEAGSVVALPVKTSPKPETATVADFKPLDGEIIAPTKGEKKVAPAAADNGAQFASVADRIRARTQRGVLMLVANGRDLTSVKEKMGHGRFGDWLKREFGWSERTAQNYMNAARAFDELAERGCAPESVALLPPTTLYNFDRLSGEHKDKCAKAIKSGTIAKALKKTAASKKASAATSTDKDRDAAEELAKLVAGALLASFKIQVGAHAGFASPAFGGLLQKEFARSLGAASSGKAGRRKRMEEVADLLQSLKEAVEEIRSEQEEAFENMPESLQGSEKGEAAQEIIAALQSAADSIEEAGDSLSGATDL